MIKLAICNMCYIDEYTCAFREYYYKGTYNIEESKEIRKLYFTKLPEYHCRYYSGTFNNTKIKWKINRNELYSVYKCLLSFEPYIVYNKFIIRTYNTQVKWWLPRKIQDSITTKEIRRLVLNILNFTFTIEVIKTDKNVIADYLS